MLAIVKAEETTITTIADPKQDLSFPLITPDPLIITNTITATKKMIMLNHMSPPELENLTLTVKLHTIKRNLNPAKKGNFKLLLKLLLKVLTLRWPKLLKLRSQKEK